MNSECLKLPPKCSCYSYTCIDIGNDGNVETACHIEINVKNKQNQWIKFSSIQGIHGKVTLKNLYAKQRYKTECKWAGLIAQF
jgi:hypothetical protein